MFLTLFILCNFVYFKQNYDKTVTTIVMKLNYIFDWQLHVIYVNVYNVQVKRNINFNNAIMTNNEQK